MCPRRRRPPVNSPVDRTGRADEAGADREVAGGGGAAGVERRERLRVDAGAARRRRSDGEEAVMAVTTCAKGSEGAEAGDSSLRLVTIAQQTCQN
jgi:hypothetical protein